MHCIFGLIKQPLYLTAHILSLKNNIHTHNMLYSLKNNNQYICVAVDEKRYPIYFKSVNQARKVHYHLGPSTSTSSSMMYDGKAQSLIIPKSPSSKCLDPVYDLGFYLHTESVDSLSSLLLNTDCGAVLCQELLFENNYWFTYRCAQIGPFNLQRPGDPTYLNSLYSQKQP